MKTIYNSISKIINIENLTRSIFSMVLKDDNIARTSQPGQFLMVQAGNDNNIPLLRRAFSVARILDQNHYELLIQNVGLGTGLLQKKMVNQELKVLGPLGTSFNTEKTFNAHVKIVVGGIGVAPAFGLFDKIKKNAASIEIYYGARSKEHLIDMKDLNEFVQYSTENGTIGYKGFITDLLSQRLSEMKTDKCVIFACGPNPMLHALEKTVRPLNVFCEVSVETLMACGMGVCMGCPVELKNEPGKYMYACKEGPVFNIRDINLDQII